MQKRLNLRQIDPKGMGIMLSFESHIKQLGIDPVLLELIKIRASQINGCLFCINMHTKDARKAGETEQRIYALNA
jgi:AhpD family alkylhydroperoxidase